MSNRNPAPSSGWQSNSKGSSTSDSLKDDLSKEPIQGNQGSSRQNVSQDDTLPSVDALPSPTPFTEGAIHGSDSSSTSSSDKGVLPPWVPTAAGAAAGGAAAVGAILTMAASGVRPREVWDGLHDLLTQRPTVETPIDEQAAYDEALKRLNEEHAQDKPWAGKTNEKGEVFDAAVGWVKKEDQEILTGQKAHTKSSGRGSSVHEAFDQVAEEKKKLEDIQKNRVDQEKKWNQEDVETIFQREAASTRGVMSKDRLAFLGQLYFKSETLAGMDDQVAAQRELEQLGAIIKNQMKPGYRPQYTLRDLAEDYVMRSGATALDLVFTKGYANAAVTAFQTAREDIRFGADNMTALKDGVVAGGIEAAIVGVGQVAGKVGVSQIGAMATTSGTVHGTLSFRDALKEGKSLEEALGRGLKDGAISGGQTFAMGKLMERAGEIELSSGSKGTGRGLPIEEMGISKTGKGPSGRFSEELPPSLAGKKTALQNALKSGDPKAVTELYKNEGMKDLYALEKGGHLSSPEAKTLNKVITRQVNEAVDMGTRKSVFKFQDETGVRLKEVLIGDSGSSARGGGVRSVKTDADRTKVAVFEENSLKRYAWKENISVEEANNRLQQKFGESHNTEVESALNQKGLSSKDVAYQGYDGIGPTKKGFNSRFDESGKKIVNVPLKEKVPGKAGLPQDDIYPEGFTSARQSQGQTTVYKIDSKDGSIHSYKTSGDALVDQNALSKAKYEGKSLAQDPRKIPVREMGPILDQQKLAAQNYKDPKSLAKAVGRSAYTGGRLKSALQHGEDVPAIKGSLSPEMKKISQELSNNPQNQQAVLKKYKLTPEEYVQRAKKEIEAL